MSRFAAPSDHLVDEGWQTHQLTPSSDSSSSATLHDIGSPVSTLLYHEDAQKYAAGAYPPRSSDSLAAQHRRQREQQHMEDLEQQRYAARQQHARLASYPPAPVDAPSQQPVQQQNLGSNGHYNVEAAPGDGKVATSSWQDSLARFRANWHASIAHGGALTHLLHACLGEFFGNFFIALPVALTIAEGFMLDGGNVDSGKFVNIALSLGVSVALSVLCFVRISGTSLHSSVTVCMALFGRIAWWRVPFQLAAQCLGAFMAEMVANAVYWNVVAAVKTELLASTEGEETVLKVLAFSTIYQTLKQFGRTSGQIFLAELMSSFLASIAIASLFDRVNPFSNLAIAGPVLGAFYAVHTLAFTAASTMGNPAHDLGSRMACAALLGKPEACFYPSETANAFLTPILGMLIGFTVFFFFLSSGSDMPKKKEHTVPDAEAGQSVRQGKRAFLRPFQYKNRGGSPAAANPHRRVVSFGNKMDHAQGFQSFVRLQETDVAGVVDTTEQQPRNHHPSPAPSVDSIRLAAVQKSWRHDESHNNVAEEAGAIEHLKAAERRSSIASGHWLIRSDSAGSSLNGTAARKHTSSRDSGPSSETVPMSMMAGRIHRLHSGDDVQGNAL